MSKKSRIDAPRVRAACLLKMHGLHIKKDFSSVMKCCLLIHVFAQEDLEIDLTLDLNASHQVQFVQGAVSASSAAQSDYSIQFKNPAVLRKMLGLRIHTFVLF